ncbi:hypothetical protein GF366_00350, partial [Candidatus Peregrinibacteria bacterium]|nr:hypothetical protein [Candidatus Peregrinibacteria bacterium]
MASKKETKFNSDNLGDDLRNIHKPELDDERKKRIKNNVMSQLEIPVIRYIRSLVSSLKLDPSRYVLIKEKVFDLLESKRQKRFYISNIFTYHKKFVSAFVLFLIFFGMFSFVNFYSPGVVLAEEFTVLDTYRGDVCVERDGEKLEVEKGMRIYQNDKITTGEDGFASIKFFDDSVSRLDERTRVVINELLKPSDTSIESHVEVSLLEGEMWSRVVNLVEGESSFVVEANDVFTAAQRAAFNVRVFDSSIEIGVFDHMVNVSSSDDNEKGEKIVSGKKAFLNNSKEVEVSEIDKDDKQIAWVRENLDNDRLYLLEVEERLFTARLK